MQQRVYNIRDTGQECWWTEAETGRSLAASASKWYRLCCRRMEETTSASVCSRKAAAFWIIILRNWTNWVVEVDLMMEKNCLLRMYNALLDQKTRFLCLLVSYRPTEKALVRWGGKWYYHFSWYLIYKVKLDSRGGLSYGKIVFLRVCVLTNQYNALLDQKTRFLCVLVSYRYTAKALVRRGGKWYYHFSCCWIYKI